MMKATILGIAAIAICISACSNRTENSKNNTNDASTQPEVKSTAGSHQPSVSSNEIITAYLRLKNALANDNGPEAASAGKDLSNALQKADTVNRSGEQKKVYNDVRDD